MKKKHPGGAPKKYFVDTRKLVKLAKIGCTIRECADVLDCTEQVIQDSYLEFYTKGRQNLKERLRRKQITAALQGSNVMLIWLGKQYLEQKDKSEIAGEGGEPILVKAIVEIVTPKGDNA